MSCELSDCAFARRHYGRRRGDQRNSDLLHDDDCRIDILQQIHCYILHSIEFSNISQSERMEMETENREMKESNDGGTTQTQPNVSFLGGPSTKFVSSTGSGGDGDVEYTEGIRYWYWSQAQKPQNAELVKGIYSDLKQEMLSGGRIDNDAWNRLVKFCETLLGSNWVKKITANGNGYDIYGIKSGVPLDMAHLVVLKLYTDFDDLNHQFCEQFRLKVFGGHREESISSIRKRNRRYFNMAKQLSECVQSFGQMLVGKKTRYYRGVKIAFVFSRFISRFHVPLSTSKAVCAVFMVLTGTVFLHGFCRMVCQKLVELSLTVAMFCGSASRKQKDQVLPN